MESKQTSFRAQETTTLSPASASHLQDRLGVGSKDLDQRVVELERHFQAQLSSGMATFANRLKSVERSIHEQLRSQVADLGDEQSRLIERLDSLERTLLETHEGFSGSMTEARTKASHVREKPAV